MNREQSTRFVLIVLLTVCCLASAWFCRWPSAAGQTVQPSSKQGQQGLQGEAALTQLKQTGQYDSLQAAMRQARFTVSHEISTPLRRAAWHAPNPANGYDAYVTEEGVSISLNKGALHDKTYVSLTLRGIGYGEALHYVGGGTVSGDRQTIRIVRDGEWKTLEEWYVNSEDGLEHGFTLREPPRGRKRRGLKLRLALAVSDDWRALASDDGQQVSLLGPAESFAAPIAAIDYSKLVVWDAHGQQLKAALRVEDERVVIEVDDAEATYPLRIDPIFKQQQKLTAPDAAADDGFGSAVALSGNTALISAPFDDVTFPNQGSAYVFARSGSGWTFQAKLTATDAANSDRLGSAVALSGDTAVLGAPDKNAAYVYTRSGTSWSQQQKLTANIFGGFGRAVALSGESVIIGANFESIGGAQTGAAYVFTRSGTLWTQQQKLTASDGAQGDNFGGAVALDSDTALVGAAGDDLGTVNNRGSVYVFARSGTSWTQQLKLTASDGAADDNFGNAVALSGDTAAVGAALRDSGANANQGAAYVFTRVGTIWTQQQRLTASEGSVNDFFGYNVALSGDVLVAGALGNAFGQGAAYVFARSGALWTQQNKLVAADGASNDGLGRAVALGGDTVLVGAAEDDGAFNNQGAAYVLVLCPYTQQQKLMANDGATNDYFGGAVALDGDTVLVGAQVDNSAYVFTRSGTTPSVWMFQQKLTAVDGGAFGLSVALSSDTALVGASISNGARGAAYVFTRIGTTWSLQEKLTANDGAAISIFGRSVALSGNTALVGASTDNSTGAAYVFTRSSTVWIQQQKLTPFDGVAQDNFGLPVALSGDTALVGAQGDDSRRGSAYVFTRSGTTWSLQQKLTANDGAASDRFSSAVALGGDTLVVGASQDDSGANVDQGAAYVFTRSGTVWTQQPKLTASDGAANDFFGSAVALSDGTVLVGADGDESLRGSAYVFTRSGTVWTQQQILTANDGATGDRFGNAVAVSGDTALVGAFQDDIGTNVDQGSAYVFICSACPTIALNPASLPNGVIGTSYNQNVTASGGAGPYQFALSSGTLPPGFTLAPSGLLLGTPTTAGTYSFTLTALIQSSLCAGSRSFTLVTTSAISQVASVSAASYTAPLAPESIAAAFGANLSATTQVAAMNPLPTQLAGVSLKVKDALGVERLAPLFFVSSGQINYQIPPGTANGTATVTVTNNNNTVGSGPVNIVSVAPGQFAANANAQGIAAALALRVRGDGSLNYEPVAQFDTGQNRFVALPIDLGPTSDQLFLVLYGTGIRLRGSLSAVRCSIGGTNSEILFADAAPGFVGLDQVNVSLPRSLAGRGDVDIVLSVDGKTANTVRVSIR